MHILELYHGLSPTFVHAVPDGHSLDCCMSSAGLDKLCTLSTCTHPCEFHYSSTSTYRDDNIHAGLWFLLKDSEHVHLHVATLTLQRCVKV